MHYHPYSIPNAIKIDDAISEKIAIQTIRATAQEIFEPDPRKDTKFIVAHTLETLRLELNSVKSSSISTKIVALVNSDIDWLSYWATCHSASSGIDIAFYAYKIDPSSSHEISMEADYNKSGGNIVLFVIKEIKILEKIVYALSNAVYRMSRWFWESATSLSSSDKDETRFPIDHITDPTPFYTRGASLKDRLLESSISDAFIAYRDNIYTPNKLFFIDRKERPIFSFNRHFSQRMNYILTRLESHQVFGCENFKKLPTPKDKKMNTVFWRGQTMGCTNYLDGWAMHLTSFAKLENVDPQLRKAILLGFPRFGFCLKYYNENNFDVGFSGEIPGYDFLRKPRVSLEYANQHLFQVAIDGNDWASSLPWQLLNSNVVLMPRTKFESIFTFNLIPSIHYVLIRDDFESLPELRDNLIKQPQLCEDISINAQNYMQPFCDEPLQAMIEDLIFERYKLVNLNCLTTPS